MYLVWSSDRSSIFYTDGLDVAERVYQLKCEQGGDVELLFGDPGHFRVIKSNKGR